MDGNGLGIESGTRLAVIRRLRTNSHAPEGSTPLGTTPSCPGRLSRTSSRPSLRSVGAAGRWAAVEPREQLDEVGVIVQAAQHVPLPVHDQRGGIGILGLGVERVEEVTD